MEIYTDGSCPGNPSCFGGWAFIVVEDGKIIYEDSGSICNNGLVTNNIAEITAIIKALEYCQMSDISPDVIYSDSTYCVNIVNKWYHKWISDGTLYKNKPLVDNMMALFEKVKTNIVYVGRNNHFTSYADCLAKTASDNCRKAS